MSNPIEDIMNSLVASIDSETPDEIKYQDIMSANKDSSLYEIMNTYDMAASKPHMIVNKIIKQKYGLTHISDQLYWYIREFPVMIDKLSNQIEKEEGSTCCVDKAWSRSFEQLHKLIEESK